MIKLTMVLAHGPDHPEGDITDRLNLELMLTNQGHIDAASYEAAPAPWLATRQIDDRPPRHLEVIRLDEGWALQSTNSLDDPIWVFEGSVFRPGELVRLRRPDGHELLFRIVASEAA